MTPVGITEIAQMAGVTRWAVDNWRRPERHCDFPAPAWELSGGPVWDWAEVAAWLERTGRPLHS